MHDAAREFARWIREGIEEGLRDRFAAANPVTRGVVTGVYEGITDRKLKLPRRRRPWSMRSPQGTPWSFRQNGRPRKLMTQQMINRRIAQRRARAVSGRRRAGR